MPNDKAQHSSESTTNNRIARRTLVRECPMSGKCVVACSCGVTGTVDRDRVPVRCPSGQPWDCLRQLPLPLGELRAARSKRATK